VGSNSYWNLDERISQLTCTLSEQELLSFQFSCFWFQSDSSSQTFIDLVVARMSCREIVCIYSSWGGCLYTCYMGVKDAIVRRHYYAGE
ncbi:hypothetical protein ES288_D01G085500v1, partial [Gossypium darwinii]